MSQGDILPKDTLARQRSAGAQVLYIDGAEHRLYQRFAESAMTDMAARHDLPPRRRAELCYVTTRELVREVCDSSHLEELAGQRHETWADSLATLACQDETALDGMLSMLAHDYYTYTHMVNVSTMVTALAFRLGQRDQHRLSIIASGGLLHDIGKMRINPDTLNKTGRLCDFFSLAWSVLSNYNPDSPYISLANWSGRGCHECGYVTNDNDLYFCDSCENDVCGECSTYCARCDCTVCVNCQERCPVCNETVCSGCMTKCSTVTLCCPQDPEEPRQDYTPASS